MPRLFKFGRIFDQVHMLSSMDAACCVSEIWQPGVMKYYRVNCESDFDTYQNKNRHSDMEHTFKIRIMLNKNFQRNKYVQYQVCVCVLFIYKAT